MKFKIIGKGQGHPFRTRPPLDKRKSIKLNIKGGASGAWKYIIKYKNESDGARFLDPKITVMPAPLIDE